MYAKTVRHFGWLKNVSLSLRKHVKLQHFKVKTLRSQLCIECTCVEIRVNNVENEERWSGNKCSVTSIKVTGYDSILLCCNRSVKI